MTKPAFNTITTTIPKKYKWKAIDKDGTIFVYTSKPYPDIHWSDMWFEEKGDHMELGKVPKPKDFTKTLERI